MAMNENVKITFNNFIITLKLLSVCFHFRHPCQQHYFLMLINVHDITAISSITTTSHHVCMKEL